jgi:hypothetical protein
MNTRLIIFACVIFSAISRVNASWIDVPLEEVIAGSQVVVIGKIESIRVAKPSNKYDYQYDTAYITVSKVLKNELKNRIIKKDIKLPLAMPSINNRVSTSVDIRYEYGKEGIWILEFRDKVFRAEYLKDYQPLTNEKEITLILEKQGSKYIDTDNKIHTFYGMRVSSMIQVLGIAISLLLVWRHLID